MPSLSFNDGRYIKEEALITLALTPSGLAKLGLPEDALETFPAAFLSTGQAEHDIVEDTGPGQQSRILENH